jgi:hypothetical protein
MNWVKSHFRRYGERKPWGFCWRIAIEGTLVTLAVGVILGLLGLGERDLKMDFAVLVFAGVIAAPLLETLLFQAFPVWIARLCKARLSIQIVASVVPFFLVHAIEGIGTGIAAGLIGGFYFAFTYVHWRVRGRWAAFWVTAVSHSIHNGILIALAFAFGEI